MINETAFKHLLIDFGIPIDTASTLQACQIATRQWLHQHPNKLIAIQQGFDALEGSEPELPSDIQQFIHQILIKS